ncbi:MAG: carboxypeptidase-like regulatory domain-containing protein, partial [Bryobacteraceae bacterium]
MRILVAAVCFSFAALAADVTGTISGIVRDASGAVVPSAQVRVVNTGTNAAYGGVSDDQGVFAIRALPVGVYDLAATVSGFKKFESKGIRLQVNEIARVDVALAVGET